MEGTGGVHEDVKALPWGVIKKLRKGMLMLQGSLGNATEEQEIVQWGGIGHKGILNSKHLCCQIWYNILRKHRACRSATQTNYCHSCVRLLQKFLVRHAQPNFFLLLSTPFPTSTPNIYSFLLPFNLKHTRFYSMVSGSDLCPLCLLFIIRCMGFVLPISQVQGKVMLMHLQAEMRLSSGIYWNAIKDVTLFPFLKIPFLLADCLEFARKIFGKSCSLIISF